MTHSQRIFLAAALVGVVSLVATAILAPRIDLARDAQAPDDVFLEHLDSLPPSVALATAALGSFRGLIVDALWYRANKLKEDGKFYEANHLSKVITQLQPRFPQVWVFHAWNMAYNISVATHTADERWYWVNSGIRLLRDQGIPLNVDAPILYKELGWIFSHKIGQTSDDMHWYYKRKLAQQWQEILGAPADGATTEQTVEAMRRIAAAPGTLAALLSEDQRVGPLWDYLAALEYEPDARLLRQIGGILMFHYSPDRDLWVRLGIRVPEQFDQRLDRIFRDASFGPGVDPLLDFLRKRVIQETYHMKPAVMVDAMEQFGPLDWRHPAAHGCYWNHLGVKAVEKMGKQDETSYINIYRARLHAIQDLAHRGKVSFDPRMSGPPDLLPDARFIEMYEKGLDEARKYLERIDATKGTMNSFEAGHENFLTKYLVDAYMTGGVQEAQEVYDKLRRLYGHKIHNDKRYKLALHELVFSEFKDVKDLMYVVSSFCRSMIFRAIHQGLGSNETSWFEHGIEAARSLYEAYHVGKSVNPGTIQDRQNFPPLDVLVTQTYLEYMSRPGISLTRRVRVWRNTPLELRRRVYDRLYPRLASQVAALPVDMDEAFPAPGGMDEYRKLHKSEEVGEKKRQEGAETIEKN